MLERKLLNIFAEDREKPTIVVAYSTYTEKPKSKGRKKVYVDTFSVWVREDMYTNVDVMNYANMFLRETYIYKKDKPILEKDIYKTYQMLFSKKLWENYKVEKETFLTKKLLEVQVPYRNFVRIDEHSMKRLVEKKMIKYNNSKEI